MFVDLIVFSTTLSVVTSDYLCNDYCPTRTSVVGYGTYVSSSAVCDTQICTNACVDGFLSCAIGKLQLVEGMCSLSIITLIHIVGFILSSVSKYRK